MHAFEKSHYPLILCIEVHCSLKQQLIMVDLLKASFGNMLVTGVVDDAGLDHLPSPESLKNKILILGRKLPRASITATEDAAAVAPAAGDVTEDDESAESIKQRNNERPGSIKRIRLAREFSNLINYCQFHRFKSFAHSAKHGTDFAWPVAESVYVLGNFDR